MKPGNVQRPTSNVQRSTDATVVASPHGEHAALRPCPNPACRCQGAAVRCLAGEVYMVVCPECQMQGPESLEGAASAAALWNCLPQPMAVVCAGCQRELKPRDRSRPVSHGICRECATRLYGAEMAAEVFAKQTEAVR